MIIERGAVPGVWMRRKVVFDGIQTPVVQLSSQSLHWPSYSAMYITNQSKKLNSVTLVRKRTIPTERPRLVGEVSAKIWG
jgi:hypothetical protein